jgi:transcriptional regulator with XRE-family HTH domain
MSDALPNYLVSHRKRTGLSQDEVAFLLGCENGTTVGRHERSSRIPDLAVVLTYELVFGVPARRMFSAIFREVEERTTKRAQVLARRLSAAKRSRVVTQKLDLLSRITSGSARGHLREHED